jgi:hypothetical protein
MLKRHIKSFSQQNFISFKLMTYDGHRIIYPMDTLRSFSNPTRETFSDVFIFENSSEYESYVFVIEQQDENP